MGNEVALVPGCPLRTHSPRPLLLSSMFTYHPSGDLSSCQDQLQAKSLQPIKHMVQQVMVLCGKARLGEQVCPFRDGVLYEVSATGSSDKQEQSSGTVIRNRQQDAVIRSSRQEQSSGTDSRNSQQEQSSGTVVRNRQQEQSAGTVSRLMFM
ncbi:hypothetical protein P4O66_008235 [Electrophorus voltai]|uniref:Uncharacterized protein n=1 Tax=Electrophorus voltai TaxID=2609070 RepID=A0AAD8ZE92_9TELE|nr:hypothetical protein P4O66_008235 [Electrophorus voltai]